MEYGGQGRDYQCPEIVSNFPFGEEISTKFKSLEAVVKICSPNSSPNPSPSTQEVLNVPEG